MNRILKFRAWLKETKEMIQVYDISWNKDMINTEGAWRFFDEIVIMQYTGLKDKNGVEIYEGDILQTKHSGRTFIGKVYYETGIWYGACDYLDVFDGYLKCEVIGNIYDNPELLEVANAD